MSWGSLPSSMTTASHGFWELWDADKLKIPVYHVCICIIMINNYVPLSNSINTWLSTWIQQLLNEYLVLYVLCKYLWIWPVTGMLNSVDVIIFESGEGGGQMFTTVLLALAVAKWPSSPANATKWEGSVEVCNGDSTLIVFLYLIGVHAQYHVPECSHSLQRIWFSSALYCSCPPSEWQWIQWLGSGPKHQLLAQGLIHWQSVVFWNQKCPRSGPIYIEEGIGFMVRIFSLMDKE